VDQTINNGCGPYCFRLQGENYHRMGSLMPENDPTPKFAHIYIFDTKNEIQNRINVVRYLY
jgi:hypothetical protein